MAIPKIIAQWVEKRPKNAIPFAKEKWLKHLPNNQKIRTIQLAGYSVAFTRPWELLHTWHEIFVEEIYQFVSPANSPYIVDCGANIGLALLYYKQLFPNCKVEAFEPDPENYKLLARNMEANSVGSVQLHQKAVWSSDAGVQFEAKGTHASRIVNNTDHSTTIPSVRLKTLLNQRVDFLKIDIEGAELEVLTDCADVLKNVSNLFLEYHGKSYETSKLQSIISIINDAGFSVYIKNAADLLQHPFVNKVCSNSPFDVQLNIFCYRP